MRLLGGTSFYPFESSCVFYVGFNFSVLIVSTTIETFPTSMNNPKEIINKKLRKQ